MIYYIKLKKIERVNVSKYFDKMNRPMSPTTILTPPTITEDINIGIEPQDINNAAQIGFDYLKSKLQKTLLTPGDILLEFWNYNEPESTDMLVPLFCLSVLVLMKEKNALNEISPEIHNKLLTYTIEHFHTKT